MICFYLNCAAQLWLDTRSETEAAAADSGWRFQNDGKTPALSIGVALCPAHAGHASEFQPAAAKGTT